MVLVRQISQDFRFSKLRLLWKAEEIRGSLTNEKRSTDRYDEMFAIYDSMDWFSRENLQEHPIYNGKIDGFRLRCSLKPIHWIIEMSLWFLSPSYCFLWFWSNVCGEPQPFRCHSKVSANDSMAINKNRWCRWHWVNPTLHSNTIQWEFQDPKMEVLYHIQ